MSIRQIVVDECTALARLGVSQQLTEALQAYDQSQTLYDVTDALSPEWESVYERLKAARTALFDILKAMDTPVSKKARMAVAEFECKDGSAGAHYTKLPYVQDVEQWEWDLEFARRV